jgi:hypothetical protein
MTPFRRSTRSNSVMFAAHYEDGRTAYFVIDNHEKTDDHLAGSVARERQASGELPEGAIKTVKRVR